MRFINGKCQNYQQTNLYCPCRRSSRGSLLSCWLSFVCAPDASQTNVSASVCELYKSRWMGIWWRTNVLRGEGKEVHFRLLGALIYDNHNSISVFFIPFPNCTQNSFILPTSVGYFYPFPPMWKKSLRKQTVSGGIRRASTQNVGKWCRGTYV